MLLCLSALAFQSGFRNILKGEGLLNDASGLVAFRGGLGIARPEVSPLERQGFPRNLHHWRICSGGDLDGLCEPLAANITLRGVRASDIASELLLELSLPLLTFFLAEELHVSGIIAVVVSGDPKASRFKHITLLEARVDTVSHTVWNTVNFILNGSVFVILGNGIGNDP